MKHLLTNPSRKKYLLIVVFLAAGVWLSQASKESLPDEQARAEKLSLAVKPSLTESPSSIAKPSSAEIASKPQPENSAPSKPLDESTEHSIIPSQQFQKMIAEPTTPGTKVNLAERAAVLKDEFRYASTATKIQILQSLSVSSHLDFMMDALKYEKETPVRQAAVYALFFSDDPRATSAMLDVLHDADEALVMTTLNVLSRTEDEALRQQISSSLANHPSKAIQITLKNLGYEVFH